MLKLLPVGVPQFRFAELEPPKSMLSVELSTAVFNVAVPVTREIVRQRDARTEPVPALSRAKGAAVVNSKVDLS